MNSESMQQQVQSYKTQTLDLKIKEFKKTRRSWMASWLMVALLSILPIYVTLSLFWPESYPMLWIVVAVIPPAFLFTLVKFIILGETPSGAKRRLDNARMALKRPTTKIMVQ